MFEINLNPYRESKIYFQFFDILLKNINENKDYFLKKLGISASTYRKARSQEQAIGKYIIIQLCKEFNLKFFESEIIVNLNELFNKLYFKIYYKYLSDLDADLQFINNLIEENYIFTPILKLMKLFLLANIKQDVFKYVEQNIELYKDVAKYSTFFTPELNELLDILNIFFVPNYTDQILLNKYNNNLIYFAIASRLCDDSRFSECILFSKKVERLLFEEKNYRRLLLLNLKVMHSLNSLGRFDECYEISKMQLISLKSFNDVEFEYDNTVKNFVISCIALDKYDIVSNLLLNKDQITMNELFCLLISVFYTNKSKYIELYNDYCEVLNDINKNNIELLNLYLFNKNKKNLDNLKNININQNIFKALKRSQIA